MPVRYQVQFVTHVFQTVILPTVRRDNYRIASASKWLYGSRMPTSPFAKDVAEQKS